MTRFVLNDALVQTDLPSGLPVLDFVRDAQNLVGTKHACREGDCGACLVLVGNLEGNRVQYRAVCSCLLPLAAVGGRHVVTIEGINRAGLTPVQRLMVDEGAVQCGFCTPGIVVALTGFLLSSRSLDPTAALAAVEGNICRCTGYASIRRALSGLCADPGAALAAAPDRLAAAIAAGVVPPYFAGIPDRLRELEISGEPASSPPGALPVAGGTDLYVQRPDEYAASDVHLIGRTAPVPVWEDGDSVYLAGSSTVEELRRSPTLQERIPNLERFMRLVSSQPIRERATVAGNIVNASPIGDLTILLLALDADLGLVTSADSRRTLPLRALFRGYKELDLAPAERIEWVRFQSPGPGTHINFEKVSKRTHLDIASVNAAASIRVDGSTITEAHLSAGGVAPVPLYLARASDALRGQSLAAAAVHAAAEAALAEISPISDVRGSAGYKRLLLRQLVHAHFHVLFDLDTGVVP